MRTRRPWTECLGFFNDPEADRVEVRTTALTPRAQDVFGPEELEERILAHQERVVREEVVTSDDLKRRLTGVAGNPRKVK